MGDSNYRKRVRKEHQVNPATHYTFAKFGKGFINLISQILVSGALTLSGRRKRAQRECHALEVNTHSVCLGNHGQSLRLLHLSDFHLDTCHAWAEQWESAVSALDYDCTVFTGDFFNAFRLPDPKDYAVLKQFVQSLSPPLFGILGNHDSLYLVPILEDLGIRMLLNETVFHPIREGKYLQITGVDDPHYFETDDLQHALKSPEAPVDPSDCLRLILTHAPKNLQNLASQGFDFCLSGHTHGGQLRTSALKPILRNGNYIPSTIGGAWTVDGMTGYTSVGMGTGRLCYRLNCNPEIVLHQIQW